MKDQLRHRQGLVAGIPQTDKLGFGLTGYVRVLRLLLCNGAFPKWFPSTRLVVMPGKQTGLIG